MAEEDEAQRFSIVTINNIQRRSTRKNADRMSPEPRSAEKMFGVELTESYDPSKALVTERGRVTMTPNHHRSTSSNLLGHGFERMVSPSPTGAKACLEHGKPRSLICVTCKQNVCDTCALFGSHKSHDVREKSALMDAIATRTTQLMDCYQQIEKETDSLKNPAVLNKKYQYLANR